LRRKIGKDGLVEDSVDFTPIRKSKVKKYREFLKEIKLLECSTLKLGDKDYHNAPLIFSYDMMKRKRSVLMRRLHMKQHLLEPCDVFTRNLRI